MKLQVSMEILICELGTTFQPFQENYDAHKSWGAHSWLKMLWEKAWAFGLEIQVNNVPLKFAREGMNA